MKYLAAALLLIAVNAYAGIGTVTETKGTGCEIQRGKSQVSGNKGAAIESMDTYITDRCTSNLTFKDDTKVKVNEHSRLVIDDFVYDPKQSDAGKLALKVGMGTVRYASGQIAKNNPQHVNVKTPSANIAVRGTDFTMTVDEAGQSLVILLPSCKDENDQKKYELEEQRCKVGKIIVETLAGSVTLEEAFSGTFIFNASTAPTAPTIINIVESKIGNSLLLAPPKEIQRAIADANGQSDKERQRNQQDQDLVKDQSNRNLTNDLQNAGMLKTVGGPGSSACNSTTSVCVRWEREDQPEISSRGKGVAYRETPFEHYAEVKTEGYSSNTTVTIVHDDQEASTIIGDGMSGGNVVYIKQNLGVLRRR